MNGTSLFPGRRIRPEEIIFGNDVDIDDIIWMGKQPTMKEQGILVGIDHTAPLAELENVVKTALGKGQKIHFAPPYRGETIIQISDLLGIPHGQVRASASEELIRAIVKLRMIKEDVEVAEIEKMVNTAYLMHTTAMKMAMPGVVEREIAGVIEGIALSNGGPVSFPVILTINGQTFIITIMATHSQRAGCL